MKSAALQKKLFFVAAALMLVARGVQAQDALVNAARGSLGVLPSSMPSDQNPMTPEKIALGRLLYFEPRISVDGTVSCARCHLPGLYATDGVPKAIGNNGKLNPRNAPTVLNAAQQIAEHWIGNRTSVEDQAKQALIGPPFYGMPSYDAAAKALVAIPGYAPLFKAAFPQDPNPISADNFALAVGAFERTLVTPAPFDAFLNGDAGALTPAQKRGLGAFMDMACSSCHTGPFVGGQIYMPFGGTESYWTYTKSRQIDVGRFAVTQDPADKYSFKVPVLRNVAMTPPYFHDGSVETLSSAVRIMGKLELGADLTDAQTADIVSFLGSLTGRVPDALLTAPILPSTQGFDSPSPNR